MHKLIRADNHCHLLKEYFENNLELITQLQSSNKLEYVSTMGIKWESNLESLALKKQFSEGFLQIGLGLHPGEVIELKEKSLGEYARIESLIRENKELVDYIGEIGLDLTYEGAEEQLENQKQIFTKFCRLAKELKKPISIHCRGAWEDLIEILDSMEYSSENFNGYIHCFTGDFEHGMFFIENGFKLGINGIITFKKSEELRNTLKELVEFYSDKDINELIGLETDSPYLTPEPIRNQTNTPANIELIADYLEEFLNK